MSRKETVMETALLNNELNLSYPDGFHVMDQAELSAYNFYAAAPGWCINDPDRHIMVSVAWKQVPGLFAKMLKVKEVAKSMEGQMAQAMKAYDYRLQEYVSRIPGGKEAEGFSYQYKVQETEMSGASFSIKNKNTFYYIHMYYRSALKDQSLPVLEEILDSAAWTR